MQKTAALFKNFPEVAAGGFTRCDGTVAFFTRVQALLSPSMTVLDFGAGRGRWAEDEVEVRRELQRIQGRVQRVIGVDIDPAVKENPHIDEATVLEPLGRLPLDDHSVDLIVSDHTFEHIIDPAHTTSEMGRVLRPGGWLCARTPHRWGSTGLAANLIPNRNHTKLLSFLQPSRAERDVFPTTYNLNTKRQLRRFFPRDQWIDYSHTFTPEPAYLTFSSTALRLAKACDAVLPGPVFMIFMHKPKTRPTQPGI